jgi:hypothetical protein
MNATDLRIGNKILHCDRMQTVSEIMKKNGDYCFKTEECKSLYIYYWLIHCTSIALTEEMLLKCGFEVKTENALSRYELNDLKYYPEINEWSYRCTVINPPKHLHQLQNLYFALTGEELEVKL